MASRNGGVSYWKSVVVHDVTVDSCVKIAVSFKLQRTQMRYKKNVYL